MASTTYAINRQVRRNYQILDTIEAGLVLTSEEVKGIRQGKAQIIGSYARILISKTGIPEIWLVGSNIQSQDPSRSRKLLLNRKEISRLIGLVQAKNQTLVPLKIYGKKGKLKVELGIARGLKTHDHREVIKKRDLERKVKQELKDERN